MAQTSPANATVVKLGPGTQGCTGTGACNTTFQNINLMDGSWKSLADPSNQPYQLPVKLKVTYKESGNGATIKEDFHSLTDGNGANYFSGILTIGAAKGTKYWVTHNLAFVRSVNGTEVPVELAWPFWVSSMDTDGTGNTSAGVRELAEFGKGLSASAALSPVHVFKGAHVDDPASTNTDINGTAIVTTPALSSFAAMAGSTFMPSGLVYGTKPCASAETGDNALPVATYCEGNTKYPISDGVSLADWTKVTVGYPVGVSSFDFVYGGETMPNGPDFPDRKYALSLSVLVDHTDMKPDAISCTPNAAQIGTPMTCTVVCRNIGVNAAMFPSCNLKVRQPDSTEIKGTGGQCGTYQAVPDAADRLTQFGMLASNGALSCSVAFTPQLVGTYTLTGGTGAVNDSNGGNDETKGNNPTSRPLTAAQPADMAATVTQWPVAFGPGQTVVSAPTVRAAIRCTNVGAAAAVQADCQPAVSAGTLSALRCTQAGAPVTLPLTSLATGAAVDCLFDVTAPGTQGGTAEPTTRITLTATTSASNDGNPANNTASALADVIDAIDDGRHTLASGAGGQVTLLANDRLAANQPPLAGSTVATLTDNAGQSSLVLDTTGTALVVPASLAAGSYPLAYRLCSQREPAACDTATVTLVIEPAVEPDLTVTKTHSPALFTEGQTGDYTITVSNVGAASTQGAYTLVDTLPAGLTVAALPSVAGWDCTATRIGAATLSCTRAVALAPGATAAVVPLKVNVAVGACAAPDAGGLCQGAAALVNTVTIGGGGESNLKNNTATDPTPLQKTGAVSGAVWIDANHNRVRDAGEPPAAGMLVEIWRGGQKLAETRADASGNYRVEGLTPGSGFGVRFRDPGTGAYYGAPISKDPAGGNDPRANPTTGVVEALTIDGITVPPGATGRINQSLPLDPSGVVYDSATRAPIAGAVVELLGAGGSPVPGGCVVGGQSRLTTAVGVPGGVDGAYSFLLLVPAPAGCPGTADYRLRVTPPGAYVASTLLPPQASPLQPPAGCVAGTAVGLCAVQAQSLAPSGAEPTPYYLALHLDLSGPQVVNNHIPLDPATRSGLVLSKTADRRTAEIGDSVRYTITVRRTDAGSAALPAVEVIDRLPAGLRYIAGTARLASGSAVTSVALSDPIGVPGPQLRFVLGSLPAGGTLVLSYRVRVDLGAPLGDGINKARATTVPGDNCNTAAAARTCSNEARHQLQFSDTGAFSSDACLVGKVFVDCNHNHVQDAEELGIPGVRLYLQDGTSLISDSQGKYSHCGLAPRTHVLGVDPTTLPRGSRLTTSSSRNAGDAASLFLDLKSGELHRADFIEGSCSNTVLEQVKARRARGEVRAAETEKRGGRVLKFDGKPVIRPAQATDSAHQRGNAAGQGEPGAVKPRIDGGQAPPASAVTDTRETLLAPVPTTPTSSAATQPDAPARQPAAVQP
jgi:uncharacterized repeat protein (TIGR01451 family)